jgi:hypothetical protein
MRHHLIAGCLLVGLARVALAEPVAYPAKGQSAEQQNKDEYECHQWATKETGVDPVALAEQSAGDGGAGAKGTAGSGLSGAGIGAMRGAADGDAAGGAMHGMMMGRLIATMRSRRQMEQQQQTAGAEVKAQLQKYDQAYGACLTGRGYSVK